MASRVKSFTIFKGSNIYKLNGDLVGHLSYARCKEKRLDKTTDKLFPEG